MMKPYQCCQYSGGYWIIQAPLFSFLWAGVACLSLSLLNFQSLSLSKFHYFFLFLSLLHAFSLSLKLSLFLFLFLALSLLLLLYAFRFLFRRMGGYKVRIVIPFLINLKRKPERKKGREGGPSFPLFASIGGVVSPRYLKLEFAFDVFDVKIFSKYQQKKFLKYTTYICFWISVECRE